MSTNVLVVRVASLKARNKHLRHSPSTPAAGNHQVMLSMQNRKATSMPTMMTMTILFLSSAHHSRRSTTRYNAQHLNRKRRTSIGGHTKGYRPPLWTPVVGSLVDCGENDDDDDSCKALPLAKDTPPQAQPSSSRSPSPEIPASPKLVHCQGLISMSGIPLPRHASQEDDDEDILMSLARPRSRPH
ncbi:hypothetical protein DXG01_000858 [Tephrocybe rancida]|nr:hypothetical protein DXG01_000858 [Tephrocybe rancida]